ncbi:MAG: tetratricopeptide repeat protein [Longimicrobiales bacterium]
MSAERRTELLARARALERGRDHAGIAALLGDVDPAELVGEPELGFLLATAWRRTGQPGRALELTRQLAVSCARRGRDRLWRARLNLEAALQFDRGDTAAAESLWRTVADEALSAADDELLANAHNNLGVVFTLQGRHDEALAAYGRALAACQRRGDRGGMARAHQNLAISYRELGFLRDADTHFTAAREHAHADGSEDLVGRAEEERAILFLLAGDERLAAAAAERALVRFQRIGDTVGMGEALRVLGLADLAAQRPQDARSHLDAALAAAREGGAALLEAETLEALAAADEALGGGNADALRTEARTLFARMGADGWGRQIRARTRALAQATLSDG